MKKIKRAIVSVFDKNNIVEFVKSLSKLGIEILSTGGTGRLLKENNINFEKISDFAVGLFLLFTGLALTLISFTIIPIIGLFIAIPVLVLAVAFIGAKRSKECALIAKRTKGIFSS